MNLRKRSIQKNLKEISDDSDDSQIRTNEKVEKSSKSDLAELKKKNSKYFSDENKENISSLDEASESEDDFVEVKTKEKTKPESIKSTTDSEEDFAEVKAKAKKNSKTKPATHNTKSANKPTTSKKSNKKTVKKTSPSDKVSKTDKTSQKSPVKNKTKIENDVETLLNMERGQTATKVSKNNLDEDEDDEDFEEVEMENLHEVDARIASMSREAIEVTIGNKKTMNKKTIDMAARFERIFKALSKKNAIAAIKTHILCWLNYGFYLNKICCDQELCAIALSMNELEIQGNKNKKINLKTLKNVLVQFKNAFNLDKVKSDEFLNKNVLITRESLISSVSKMECRNYLEYILILLIALRNIGLNARLVVCFDVITMPDQRKNNKKIKNEENSDSEYDDEEMEVDDKSEEESGKKSKKRKSDQVAEKPKKATKKAKILKLAESTDEEKESIEDLAKTSKDENNNKEDMETKKTTSALLKTKSAAKNPKILSTDNDDSISSAKLLTDTNYKNHWLEVYLVDEERWITIEPFTLKIDCSTEMEKRYGKQILYVCGYDNENKVKELTKRYANDWLTSVRRARISQLDPKKLWWERTLMFYQPTDSNLDIQEEIQLKSIIFQK